jgi:L-malate glycosyltransferase
LIEEAQQPVVSPLPMKKIAHFIDTQNAGGAESLVFDLTSVLAQSGFDIEVYQFDSVWLEGKCKEHKLPILRAPGHHLYKSSRTLPLFAWKFSKFLRERKVHILHSHLYDPIIGGAMAAFCSRIPHIGTLHDVYTLEEKRSLSLVYLASLLKTNLVAVSHGIEQHLLDKGFAQNRIKTIENGVDILKFEGNPDPRLRKELGLTCEDLVFICVGRLVALKGLDILLDAFAGIRQNNVKLLLVGDGPEKGALASRIMDRGMAASVSLLGHREDVPDLLRISSCFVLASHTEGLSCSIIEAMAAGLPVIATDVGGNRELVLDGENGYLVPRADAAALAGRMLEMVKDHSRRERFGRESLRLAAERFSRQVMVQRYIQEYEQMLSSPRKVGQG